MEKVNSSLFSGDKDWMANACLNWSLDTLGLYIEGYREAADILVQNVLESGNKQDILVFPISFLYRQFIELQLKLMIRESRIFLNEGAGFPKHHRIDALWGAADSLVGEIIAKHDPTISEYITEEDVQKINRIISDFVEVDPESFAFRYPKDKKGNRNLDGVTYINLRKLRDGMGVLKETLDQYYNCISVLRDYQEETRQDY